MYIGIDLGTSGVKLLLMSEDGKIINKVTKHYGISYPGPLMSEQDPHDWFDQTIAGIKELLEGSDAKKVRAIGAGGQMHGLVMLDNSDEVIRPAILWNDGRTIAETDYLNSKTGKENLASWTGNIAFAGFTAPKILWVKEHEPENFKRAVKIMLPKDYLVYRLTGAFTTDFSDASGMLLLDVKNRKWSEDMLGICGIGEDMLPTLHESSDIAGTVKKDIAEELGLSNDVIVCAGAGDNAAAAIGTGTVGDGRCNISLGTSGTIFISSTDYTGLKNNAIHSFAHADGGWHVMGCMLSAASCNSWWMDGILGDSDYSAAQSKITSLGTNRVFFLPYLLGERSPHNDPEVRSMFIGMSPDTTREDMTQAVLEGVAYGMRDSLEIIRAAGISVTETTICGGGAKSPLWRRIISDVMNITVKVPSNDEGPALGGAILAAVADGRYKDVIEASRTLVSYRDELTIEPDPETSARYNEGYRFFRKLYPAIKDLF